MEGHRQPEQAAVSLALVTSLPGWGGGEKWFLAAARAMADRGHRVCVVGQPDGEIVRRARDAGLRAYGVRMRGILDPRTLWALGRLLRREGIQVAVVNQAREIRLVGLSQLGRRGFRLVARRGSPDPIKDNWHFRLVYRHLVDRLIVNCEALVPRVCGDAPWFDRGRLVVLPNGIDAEALAATARPGRIRAELGIPSADLVVAMVGEVGERKDQRTLLHALALWRRRGRPGARGRQVVVLLAGEGEALPALRRETRELGLDDMVRWLGFRRDAVDLMADSDLVVLPTREEGFPNTLLEAMALGRPVLTTPVDGIPELVRDGETGLLVPPRDPAALADGLARLLGDDDLRRRLGEAGLRRVRDHFSEREMMDRFERLIVELADG